MTPAVSSAGAADAPTTAMTIALSSPAAVAALARNAASSTRCRGLAAAIAVYTTSVFHRSSLGVAGLDAAERYGISAGALSVFVLLQLGVYAGMQVPTGVLVDRFGPRRLLLAAASTSALAQLWFALAPTYAGALGARALLGGGDALTFVSVVSFASQHFSARRFTLIVALVGTVGALGNVAATVPLNAALDSIGWTPTFAAAAAASLVAVVAVARFVPGSPACARPVGRRRVQPPVELKRALIGVGVNVRGAWSVPATRAGFWLHFATMTFTTMFGVLWGMPYLVAQGLDRGQASAVLTLSVVASAASSVFVGVVFGRYRAARVPFALGVAIVTVAGWSVLLLGFDGRPPHWLLAVAVAVTAVGGPASGIGFSLARDYNPVHLAGTAAGVVNVGGFAASIVAAVAVGQVLDVVGRNDADAFRLAFAAAIVVQAFGTAKAVRWFRYLRSEVLTAQERGDLVPVPAIRRRWDVAVDVVAGAVARPAVPRRHRLRRPRRAGAGVAVPGPLRWEELDQPTVAMAGDTAPASSTAIDSGDSGDSGETSCDRLPSDVSDVEVMRPVQSAWDRSADGSTESSAGFDSPPQAADL